MWYKGGCWISNWPEAYKSSDIDEKYIDCNVEDACDVPGEVALQTGGENVCRELGLNIEQWTMPEKRRKTVYLKNA